MMRARDFISHHLAHRDFPTNRACMKETDHTQETCIGVGTMNTGPEKRSGLAAVYCSDLRRAVRSAEIIGARYELDPIRVPALRELFVISSAKQSPAKGRTTNNVVTHFIDSTSFKGRFSLIRP